MNAVLNKKECTVIFDHYEDNNNVAIQLTKKRRGQSEELVATATVNTSIGIRQDYVAIKGWSENTGIEKVLIEAGVICEEAVGAIPCGMAVAKVFPLTEEAKEVMKNNQ
ncbi:hypothetical protein [Enterococcus sp.]|uniref:hypothetical protein n=1 Tax=Enterococcus sp. TaxID=35783 RepID=UPI00289FB093|nr:hypothetical protein [Enterococcus sp.]